MAICQHSISITVKESLDGFKQEFTCNQCGCHGVRTRLAVENGDNSIHWDDGSRGVEPEPPDNVSDALDDGIKKIWEDVQKRVSGRVMVVFSEIKNQ